MLDLEQHQTISMPDRPDCDHNLDDKSTDKSDDKKLIKSDSNNNIDDSMTEYQPEIITICPKNQGQKYSVQEPGKGSSEPQTKIGSPRVKILLLGKRVSSPQPAFEAQGGHPAKRSSEGLGFVRRSHFDRIERNIIAVEYNAARELNQDEKGTLATDKEEPAASSTKEKRNIQNQLYYNKLGIIVSIFYLAHDPRSKKWLGHILEKNYTNLLALPFSFPVDHPYKFEPKLVMLNSNDKNAITPQGNKTVNTEEICEVGYAQMYFKMSMDLVKRGVEGGILDLEYTVPGEERILVHALWPLESHVKGPGQTEGEEAAQQNNETNCEKCRERHRTPQYLHPH